MCFDTIGIILLLQYILSKCYRWLEAKFGIFWLLSTSSENNALAASGEQDDQDEDEDGGEGGDDDVVELPVLVIDPRPDGWWGLEVGSIPGRNYVH